jgi:hypothetical protein
MIIDKGLDRSDELFLNPTLFMAFTSCGIKDLFMRVARSTWNTPGISVMYPRCSMLKQHSAIANEK